MTDTISKEQRSELRARVRGINTTPERTLRGALRRKGIRYRSYQRIAGATVDLVLPQDHIAIFVNGCFWHGCPWHYTRPSTRKAFWKEKLLSNRRRDAKQKRALKLGGWRVVVVWEHSLRNGDDAVVDGLVKRLNLRHPHNRRGPVPSSSGASES